MSIRCTMTEEKNREILCEWGQQLQKQICQLLERLEEAYATPEYPAGTFTFKPWERPGGGGGTMGILQEGAVFEKFGVNFSEVFGSFPQDMALESSQALAGDSFWASGVSLVGHPRNPFVPAVHLNVRRIFTGEPVDAPKFVAKMFGKSWVGGGSDLTPTFPFEEDTEDFHQALNKACDLTDPTYYPRFTKECDDYFYLPHRGEPRGVGGIFFDYLDSGDFSSDFKFLQDVAAAFIDVYPRLVNRRVRQEWTSADKEKQLLKRGRYVEFNLLYDRGTQFGLKTGGNTEAILMSLPPLVRW